MKTSLIVLNCGYVESCAVSFLIFKSPEVFPTGLDALQNLAAGLLSLYEEEHGGRGSYKSQCCREFLERRQPEDVFCPRCRLRLNFLWDVEQWQAWLCQRHNQDADSWGGEFSADCPWWPWPSYPEALATPRDEILYIGEKAEHALTMALLGDEIPEPHFRNAIEQYWAGIKEGIDEWDLKHGWDGTREAFGRELDEVKKTEYPYRMGPEA